MDATLLIGLIGFGLGMLVRSLLLVERPPQVIYMEPVRSRTSKPSGWMPIVLLGAVVLLAIVASNGNWTSP